MNPSAIRDNEESVEDRIRPAIAARSLKTEFRRDESTKKSGRFFASAQL